jgi:GNAT superfamily N-acetyltransferase
MADHDITIRALREDDLPVADHIVRVAFGTFLGLPEPASFMGDADYVRGRWRADPDAAFAAEIGGELVGSNFAARWGSVGFFGPLSVRPDLWDRGIAKHLMAPVMECFGRWGVTHAGLFTFPHSRKHVGLYQRFGFWPRFLTAVMSKPVTAAPRQTRWTTFSQAGAERDPTLAACRQLTGAIYPGLDVAGEITAVARQQLGDTVLVWGDDGLDALALCHCGPGTEAGSGTCYVKFGAARPGTNAEHAFERLLRAVDEFAAGRGLARITAGVNSAREEAYRAMRTGGFRPDLLGVAMHRLNEPGYNRPGVFVIDDWR